MSTSTNYKMFVACLSPDVNENDLRTLFQDAGEIIDLKIVRKNNGESKGYGFVTFATEEIAKLVQKNFQGKDLKGKKLDIKSGRVDGCLYIRGIKKEWNPETTETKMRAIFLGVTRVQYIEDRTIPGHNRGYCFVFFETKSSARKTLGEIQNHMYSLEGQLLTGDWADAPDTSNGEETRRGVCIKGLPTGVTEEEIRPFFARFGEIDSIKMGKNLTPTPREDMAFVNFALPSSAETAVAEMKGMEIRGVKVDISLNRKTDTRAKMHRRMLQQQQMTGGNMMGNSAYGNNGYYMNQSNNMGSRYMNNMDMNPSRQYYKTRLCTQYKKTGQCHKGFDCQYAHGDQELRSNVTIPITTSSYQTMQGPPGHNYQTINSSPGGPTYPSISGPVVSPYVNPYVMNMHKTQDNQMASYNRMGTSSTTTGYTGMTQSSYGYYQ